MGFICSIWLFNDGAAGVTKLDRQCHWPSLPIADDNTARLLLNGRRLVSSRLGELACG